MMVVRAWHWFPGAAGAVPSLEVFPASSMFFLGAPRAAGSLFFLTYIALVVVLNP